MELAAYCDFGEKFANASRLLEGDGLLVIRAFEVMEGLRFHAENPTFPSANAIIRSTPGANPALFAALRKPFEEAIEYFNSNYPDLSIYRAARYLDPVKVWFKHQIRFFKKISKIKN